MRGGCDEVLAGLTGRGAGNLAELTADLTADSLGARVPCCRINRF